MNGSCLGRCGRWGTVFVYFCFFFCLGLGSVKRDAVGQTNARKRLKDGHHPKF